jgi:hypothetical protein
VVDATRLTRCFRLQKQTYMNELAFEVSWHLRSILQKMLKNEVDIVILKTIMGKEYLRIEFIIAKIRFRYIGKMMTLNTP